MQMRRNKQTIFTKFQDWHITKSGFFGMAVFELLLAYCFASLAIDRGNLWFYFLTLVFVVGVIQNVFGFFVKLIRDVRAY
jgi:hypothetical protein